MTPECPKCGRRMKFDPSRPVGERVYCNYHASRPATTENR